VKKAAGAPGCGSDWPEFRFHLFRSLIQAEEEINFWLAQLERGGLLQPTEISEDPIYNFPDALVHEVAYDSLMVQNRRRLHSGVADAIVEFLGQQAEENQQELDQLHFQNCELLAYHYSRGDKPENAIQYLEIAAQKARSNYAKRYGYSILSKVLDIKSKMGDQGRTGKRSIRNGQYRL